MRWVWAIVFGVATVLAALAPVVEAGAAPAGDGLASLYAGTVSDGAGVQAAQDAATSPEQQLVDKYAPIIGLKDQEEACDEDGEPFYPVSVDVTLGKDDVVLKEKTSDSAASDTVITAAPEPSNLYARGDQYYLDLPGNPRHAGCDYEKWFDANKDGYDPTAYAHIVSNGTDLLAVQYWFYYVFNNFNNTHESDWEMMQIVFDVGTVEEALQAEPRAVAVAQHGGGETADWTDSKLQRDGNHPIVYSASGSHATQYGQAVYLGWGENGTGFGCDITTGPTTLVPLTPLLLPSTQPDPNGDYAWLNYVGRWGERQEGEFNGPTGPSTKTAWKSPFLWQEGLRDSSIEVPLATTFGPAPTEVFCTLSTWGSNIFRVIGDNPPLFLTVVILIVGLIVSAVRYVWPALRTAFGIYRRRWRTLVLVGLFLIPVGLFFNGFQYVVGHYPPGEQVVELIGETPAAYYALALLTLIIQSSASLMVIGPMVIEVYQEYEEGDSLTFREAWSRTWDKLLDLSKSMALVVVLVVGLAVTVIGLPIAIWLLVRWIFVSQATMLDNADVKGALAGSSEAVRGRWWRVAFSLASLFVLAASPGALIGLGLLIFGSASVQTTNIVSSLIYVVTMPLMLLSLTLIYRHRELSPPLFVWLRKLIGKVRNRPAEEQAAPAA